MQKRRKGTVKSCPALVYLSKTTLICRQTMQDSSMIWPPGWQQVIRAMENSSYFFFFFFSINNLCFRAMDTTVAKAKISVSSLQTKETS